jgi:hypothetical protein
MQQHVRGSNFSDERRLIRGYTVVAQLRPNQGYLSALMKLLGHKDIRMTLCYVEVTQQDLQREFHQARQNAAHPHRLPTLALPRDTKKLVRT